MEAEDIIVNKSYLELTEKEKSLVSEWVKNEDEFNVMKEFLSQTKQLAEAQKIEASSSVRENVFSYLHESPIKKNNFFQRFLLFLFPVEKPFYRYPSFQFACMFVLFFGVFKLIDSPLKPENNLAIHNGDQSKNAEDFDLQESELSIEESPDGAILDLNKDASGETFANGKESDEMLKKDMNNLPVLTNEEKIIRITPNKSNDIGYIDDLSDEVTIKASEFEKEYKETVVFREEPKTMAEKIEQDKVVVKHYKQKEETVSKLEQDKESSKKDEDRKNQKSTTAYEEVNNTETVVTSTSVATQANSPATGGAVFTSSSLDVDTKTVQSIPLSKTNELKGFFHVVND